MRLGHVSGILAGLSLLTCGGGSGGTTTPNAQGVCSGSAPTASCGTATGTCNDGTYTCSQTRQGTCSTHNSLQCGYCPGPLCP